MQKFITKHPIVKVIALWSILFACFVALNNYNVAQVKAAHARIVRINKEKQAKANRIQDAKDEKILKHNDKLLKRLG